MKDLTLLDEYRRDGQAERDFMGNTRPRDGGVFDVPYGEHFLKVIATNSHGWEHVSVSLPHRCPTWFEMSYVYGLFFYDGEAAMQLHVPQEDHVNYHPTCLHIWRPKQGRIPRPPAALVGGLQDETRAERRARAANLRHR